jgi:hypothetical protein
VGPLSGLHAVEKRKIPFARRESKPGRPARSPSLYRLSYPSSLILDASSSNDVNGNFFARRLLDPVLTVGGKQDYRKMCFTGKHKEDMDEEE